MIYVLSIAAALAAGLTLFSGFGSTTLLLPVFALYFPVPAAVALTAVIHLANNLFKLRLLGKHAHLRIVLLFGLPALFSAPLGALALLKLARLPPVAVYSIGRLQAEVTPVKCVIALLMLSFAWLEVRPGKPLFDFSPRLLPLGGVLSGFFGGLSGHQGAFRSAFLVKSGLSTQEFLGTATVVALLVDLGRLSVYAAYLQTLYLSETNVVLGSTILASWLGSWIGFHQVKKLTIRTVQKIVAFFLAAIALGLAGGLI